MMNNYETAMTMILGKDKVSFPDEEKTAKMTGAERMVYALLPQGKPIDGGVKLEDIKRITGLTKRECYKVIDKLIRVHNIPVIGLRKSPYGYFVAKDVREMRRYSAEYRKQVMTELDRLKALEKAFEV